MRIHDTLNQALLRIGVLQDVAESTGEAGAVASCRYLREQLLFIIRTGQVYRIEDYLKGLDLGRAAHPSAASNLLREGAPQQASLLLLRVLDETNEPEPKRLILVLIATLHFIAETGQYDALDDYLLHYYGDAPWTFAWFGARDEAEAWLASLVEPPSWAHVLIGDEYFEAWYSREEGRRGLARVRVIEPYLESLVKKGLPPAVGAFNTREEAREWLTSHPASPMTFVAIAGEPHLAVYHRRHNRHTLHPVSSLREWEEERGHGGEEGEEGEEGESA